MLSAYTSTAPEKRVLNLTTIFLLAVSLSGCNFPIGNTPASLEPRFAFTQGISSAPRETAGVTETSTATISPPTTTPISAKDQVLEGWQVFTDQSYAFELRYPEDGDLVEEQPDRVRIDLPFKSGTNLQEKYLQIDNVEGADTCASPFASGYDPEMLEQEQMQIGEILLQRQSGAEGAAGNFYQWTSYSTTRKNVCASLTFVLHSLDPYNFETPVPEFDVQSETAIFDEIVASFRWLNQ